MAMALMTLQVSWAKKNMTLLVSDVDAKTIQPNKYGALNTSCDTDLITQTQANSQARSINWSV
jgi:hypothetical protein